MPESLRGANHRVMWLHIVSGTSLVFGTVFVHTVCTVIALGSMRSLERRHWTLRSNLARGTALAGLVLLMAIAGLLESTLWAGFYWQVGALPEFGEALYFSLVTFTTLGYGDITLQGEWRLLSAFEAANGIIMFGWTTAIIVAVAQRLFFLHPGDSKPD